MGQKPRPALDVARWRSATDLWIDHAKISSSDLDHFQKVEKLTLWNVTYPEEMFVRLPNLWWFDIRGGSGNFVSSLSEATGLRYLQINQIRGLKDVSDVSRLEKLELLSLYGLSKVTVLPQLSGLHHLHRIEIGQMKGLQNMDPMLAAKQLREIYLIKDVPITARDAEIINRMPNIEAFTWSAEDVPARRSDPVREVIQIPYARPMHAHEWFENRT